VRLIGGPEVRALTPWQQPRIYRNKSASAGDTAPPHDEHGASVRPVSCYLLWRDFPADVTGN
jgi:hypothetical protein